MKKVMFLVIIAAFSLHTLAQNGCPGWGPDSIKAVQSVSLYREFYKQQNYDDAYPHWLYVLQNAPGARKNTFIDGVDMLKKFIDKEKDDARKEKLIDTLMMVYDQRIKCFGEAGSVLGRKGLDMLRYRPNNTQDLLGNFSKVLELSGNSADYFVIVPYFSIATQAYKANQLSKEELFNIYQKLSAVMEYNIAGGKNADKYREAQDGVAGMLADSKLITSCADAKGIFEKKYKENPEDIALMKKMAELLKSAGCIEDPLFIEVSEKLHGKEPSASSAYFLGKAKYVQGKIQECVKYFNEAIEMETAPEKKADYLLDLAGIYSSKLDDFPTARTKAKAAAALRPNWGEPYLFIGDLYASSGKKCGPGTGFESQVITWVAIDMYQKARSVDANIADKANEKIGYYSKYMPSKEDIFFRELKEGDSFKVECWINETTTVRTRKE